MRTEASEGSPGSAVATRKGTAMAVDASCTQTETRVAPAEARSRASWLSRAACASYGDAGGTDRRVVPGGVHASATGTRSAAGARA
ncbi:hypothetical protein U6N30_04105 [Blastococcus brunescens]|uniref:Uncharacterized protein n=1 Tax=Blastococcus brunescens TaxID=1564165 RepID=A0ABZ1B3F9_9ACTN|nr:hypothetical protein [Blastococcus sp. BMG 8361]WRL64922.1 hypothetical protein U6N30_04105 [Blastococcus sp. BMG 8361]